MNNNKLLYNIVKIASAASAKNPEDYNNIPFF